MNECKHTDTPIIVKTIVSNGHTHVRNKCPLCNQIYGNPLSKSLYNIDNLPFHESRDPDRRCAIIGCDLKDVELHHFLPKAIAQRIDEDPEDWPTAYLCSFHHKLWHATVTPGLDSRTKNLEKLLKSTQP